MGEIEEALTVSPTEPPLPAPAEWSAISVNLRPFEIVTIYADLVMGRKIPRNLDAHRAVWATVHRVETPHENEDANGR